MYLKVLKEYLMDQLSQTPARAVFVGDSDTPGSLYAILTKNLVIHNLINGKIPLLNLANLCTFNPNSSIFVVSISVFLAISKDSFI